MQSYINKDGKLIVNTMILENEKEELLEFIDKAEKSSTVTTTLYNVEGDKSGIAFETGKELEQLDVTPNEEEQSFEGLYNKVEVSAIQTEEATPELNFNNKDEIIVEPEEGKYLKKVTLNRDDNLVPTNIKLGVSIEGVEGNLVPDKPDQDKSVDPTSEVQVVRADSGFELASVTVNAVPTQDKLVNPTTNRQIVEPDENKFLSSVIVNAVTSNIDNSITSENIRAGVNILGVEGDMNIVNTADANVVPGEIGNGMTAYVKGQKIKGTLPFISSLGKSVDYSALSIRHISGNNYFGIVFNNSYPLQTNNIIYRPTKSEISLSTSLTNIANLINLKSNMIKSGETVLDIVGDMNIVNTANTNATSKDILYGRTAYVNGQKLEGRMGILGGTTLIVDEPNISIDNDSFIMGKKLENSVGANYYYSDQTMVKTRTDLSNITNVCNITSDKIVSGSNILGIVGDMNIVNTADADAVSKDILYGKIAYVNGQKLVGNMTTKASTILTISQPNIEIVDNNLRMFNNLGYEGNYYYSNTSKIYTQTSLSNIANVCNITSDKIAYGENVLGVEGSHTEILPSGLAFSSSYINELPEWVNRLNTDELSSMQSMFRDCYNLKNVPNWNTAKVIGFDYTFKECSNLTTIPNFDTSNAWAFRYTFANCNNLTTAPNWDFSNLEQSSYLFANCYNLTTVPNFNFSKALNLNYTFVNCRNLVTIPNFNLRHNVNDVGGMFRECVNLIEIPNIDFSGVRVAESLYFGCTNITTVDSLNLGLARSADYLFCNCYNLTSVNELNLYNLESHRMMFANCYNLTSVNTIIFSRLNSTDNMFVNCYNLVDVPEFDVTTVNYRYGFSDSFKNCNSLSNASLSNILNMCISATNYPGLKKLSSWGITNTDLTNNVVNLPEYQDFLNAGWTIN